MTVERLKKIYEDAGGRRAQMQGFMLTVGTVVDTNDPQQMGRVRAVCPLFGDSIESPVLDIPWAIAVTPFGGSNQIGTRGAELDTTDGFLAYGLWAVPKVGAQVIVGFLDGNVKQRIWLGCLHDSLTPHTMPHGRFTFDVPHEALEEDNEFFRQGSVRPWGPYSTEEKFAYPLKAHLKEAFTSGQDPQDTKKFEWRTRGADYSVAAVDLEDLNVTWSRVADDKDFTYEGWLSRQGYDLSRIRPDVPSEITGTNFDNQVKFLQRIIKLFFSDP